jgi:hypothetical protein
VVPEETVVQQVVQVLVQMVTEQTVARVVQEQARMLVDFLVVTQRHW